MNEKSNYIAHISDDGIRTQSIKEHAEGTARHAARFASAFGAAKSAEAAALLHDCGKYSKEFGDHIRGLTNRKVDHSTAGAIEARQYSRDPFIAFCIAGHHSGLPDLGGRFSVYGDGSLAGRLKAKAGIDIPDYGAFRSETDPIPASETTMPPWIEKINDKSAFFYAHMLYSCLTDADFLDTEEFMSGHARTPNTVTLSELSDLLDRYTERFEGSDSELARARQYLRSSMLTHASAGPGLFSVSAPTGSGKTIASADFALKHGAANGMDRMIYVIPYTSIIEQTQKVFEDIFEEDNVLAHYANADFLSDDSAASDNKKLASENWDAPIIITTAVRFFESFFSNRSSSCRKLHSVSNSVIIFDEAQTLPCDALRPCLYVIAQLVGHYHCSALLCTATQPSFGRSFSEPDMLPDVPVRELCPDGLLEDPVFDRVSYQYEGELDDDALTGRLGSSDSFLCIVNTKPHAERLYHALNASGNTFCLTTNLTPADRRRSLERIRSLLKDGRPCRVISTSLIEAGVDVDFPEVWRALAGVDSILQAGGRCNREGKRAKNESVVHYFGTDEYPSYIRKNVAAAELVQRKLGTVSSPEAVQLYFDTLLYTLKDDAQLDKNGILKLIADEPMPFKTVAERFRMIEDDDCSVIIPCEDNADLIRELRNGNCSRGILRRLGLYTVSLYAKDYHRLLDTGALEPVGMNIAILSSSELYHKDTGLITSGKIKADLIY